MIYIFGLHEHIPPPHFLLLSKASYSESLLHLQVKSNLTATLRRGVIRLTHILTNVCKRAAQGKLGGDITGGQDKAYQEGHTVMGGRLVIGGQAGGRMYMLGRRWAITR